MGAFWVLSLGCFVRGADDPLTLRDGHGDPLPPGAVGRLGTVRFRHAFEVTALAFAPDGRRLASASGDATACVWDFPSGKELVRIKDANQATIATVAFAPDSKAVATGHADRTVRLWDATTGKEIREFTGHEDRVNVVVFSPNGTSLVSVSTGPALRLWDVATGKEIRRFTTPPESGAGYHPWGAVAFSPDGSLLAATHHDRTIHLWEVRTGRAIRQLKGHTEAVTSIAFAPDGKTLVSLSSERGVRSRAGNADTTLRSWDVATGRERWRQKAEALVVALSPDGRTLATIEFYGTQVALWDAQSGKPIRTWTADYFPGINALAYSPDSKVLVTGGKGQVIRLWDVATGKPIPGREGHQAAVNALAYSPDSGSLASASDDGTVRLWNTASTCEQRQLIGHEGKVLSVAFAPDGKLVASGGFDKTIRLWNVDTGQEIRRCVGHEDLVGTVAISHDGRTVASGSWDQTIRLWDLAQGKEKGRLKGHTHFVSTIALSADGKRLASGSGWDDKTVRIWDVATGKSIHELVGHGSSVSSVAYSPDGKLLASADVGGVVMIWDTADGKQVHVLREHAPWWIGEVAFSPDGRYLAVGDRANVIALYEVATGKPIRRWWRGHLFRVQAVRFAPDGKTLATGGADSLVLLWDIVHFDRHQRPEKAKLSQEELQGLWQDLGEGDPAKAYRAMSSLILSPEQTVPFLRQALRPVLAADSKQLVRLIADLDSDRFEVREQAGQALEKLGDAAAPALHLAMRDKLPLEQRRRIESLLNKATTWSAERLQIARGITVLERIGNAEAVQLLRHLAEGIPDALLTRESKASDLRLGRLNPGRNSP
jgi:WD40 repeat protein